MATKSRGVPFPLGTDANNTATDLSLLADWVNDRPGVAALTTTERNALTGTALWDGRIVLNTTTDRLNRYDLGTATWVQIPDSADIATLLATTGTPADLSATPTRGVSASAARADHGHAAPAWVAYTPTYNFVAGTGGGTIGRYQLVGKTCHFSLRLLLGTGFTIGAPPALGLPFAARNTATQDITCDAYLLDAGTTNYRAIAVISPGQSTANVWLTGGTYNALAGVGTTVPFIWAANDSIYINGTYETA